MGKKEKSISKRDSKNSDSSSLVSDQGFDTFARKKNETALTLYDPLRLYFQEMSRYELLTAEEQKALAIRARESNDKEAAHKLILSNLKLVVKIAMDFQKQWSKNLLDLIQEGNLGLLQAVEKFDPHRGTKFTYYASFWIKAYMLKFIMNNWKLVKIGTSQPQRKLFFNLNKERQQLIAQGVRPEPTLLAERLDVPEKDVIEMSQRLGGWEVSLDAPIGENSKEGYGSMIPDPGENAEQSLSKQECYNLIAGKVKEFRKTLSGRDADIFDNRIMADDPHTLQELGNKYNISRERIRQIQLKLSKKIKDHLKNEISNFEEDYSDVIAM